MDEGSAMESRKSGQLIGPASNDLMVDSVVVSQLQTEVCTGSAEKGDIGNQFAFDTDEAEESEKDAKDSDSSRQYQTSDD